MVVKWGVYSKRTTQNDRIVWVIIIQKASWKRWDMYWDEKVFRERGTDFHIMRNIFWFSTLLCSLCVSELVIASKNTQEWDRLSQCLQLSGVCKEATRQWKYSVMRVTEEEVQYPLWVYGKSLNLEIRTIFHE